MAAASGAATYTGAGDFFETHAGARAVNPAGGQLPGYAAVGVRFGDGLGTLAGAPAGAALDASAFSPAPAPQLFGGYGGDRAAVLQGQEQPLGGGLDGGDLPRPWPVYAAPEGHSVAFPLSSGPGGGVPPALLAAYQEAGAFVASPLLARVAPPAPGERWRGAGREQSSLAVRFDVPAAWTSARAAAGQPGAANPADSLCFALPPAGGAGRCSPVSADGALFAGAAGRSPPAPHVPPPVGVPGAVGSRAGAASRKRPPANDELRYLAAQNSAWLLAPENDALAVLWPAPDRGSGRSPSARPRLITPRTSDNPARTRFTPAPHSRSSQKAISVAAKASPPVNERATSAPPPILHPKCSFDAARLSGGPLEHSVQNLPQQQLRSGCLPAGRDFAFKPECADDREALPRRQRARHPGDMYTPSWVRYSGQAKEGLCHACTPGKWLQLKNSAYW
ncbi:MAG: hypothetical protein BJ554DRAFT_1156 [Olpidium bornovanus]|uniref:Uncharacterized protein n=1 Tax=Olpidium bornovanus TaxID=278681 RepID=A0A8H7ZSJ1_9FUNG|nr:MAG: hypothetical protein BJ554DRAFT_1156 [Olpidium bornovanus]